MDFSSTKVTLWNVCSVETLQVHTLSGETHIAWGAFYFLVQRSQLCSSAEWLRHWGMTSLLLKRAQHLLLSSRGKYFILVFVCRLCQHLRQRKKIRSGMCVCVCVRKTHTLTQGKREKERERRRRKRGRGHGSARIQLYWGVWSHTHTEQRALRNLANTDTAHRAHAAVRFRCANPEGPLKMLPAKHPLHTAEEMKPNPLKYLRSEHCQLPSEASAAAAAAATTFSLLAPHLFGLRETVWLGFTAGKSWLFVFAGDFYDGETPPGISGSLKKMKRKNKKYEIKKGAISINRKFYRWRCAQRIKRAEFIGARH